MIGLSKIKKPFALGDNNLSGILSYCHNDNKQLVVYVKLFLHKKMLHPFLMTKYVFVIKYKWYVTLVTIQLVSDDIKVDANCEQSLSITKNGYPIHFWHH